MPQRSRKCRRHGYHEKRIDSPPLSWPNIDFAVRLYRFSPPCWPSGWRLPLAAPRGVLWGGREAEGLGPSLDGVRTRISHLLNWPWAGGIAAVGRRAFGHPVLPKASSTILLASTFVSTYVGRGLLSCIPCRCPPLCYDSTLCLRFDIKSRECKGSSRLSLVLEYVLNFQSQSLTNAAIGNHNSAFPGNSCYHSFAGAPLSKHKLWFLTQNTICYCWR